MAWWDHGHMFIANIAKLEIQRRSPKTWETLNNLIESLNNLCDEKSQTFVEAASWADDLKSKGTNFWFEWHFLNRPINDEGLYLQLDSKQFITNSMKAMEYIQSELKLVKDYYEEHKKFTAT